MGNKVADTATVATRTGAFGMLRRVMPPLSWAVPVLVGGAMLFAFLQRNASDLPFAGRDTESPLSGLLVSSRVQDLPTSGMVTGVSASLTIANTGASTRRLIGASSDCGCLRIQGLPVDVPGGETVDLEVLLPMGDKEVSHQVAIYSDGPDQRPLLSRLVVPGRNVVGDRRHAEKK